MVQLHLCQYKQILQLQTSQNIQEMSSIINYSNYYGDYASMSVMYNYRLIIIEQQNLMSSNSSLTQWLSKLGIGKQLNNNDILSGITVNAVLAKTIQNYASKLSTTNTATSRINNWNAIINELEKINIHVNQQDKAKIMNGDDKIVYNILYEIKERHDKNRSQVQVDLNKIDARSDPKTSKSLLELFILVIIKYYGFSVKEAVALLSNDSKYLAHILAKGFKENPKPVESMILQFEKLLPQITAFCRNKENETFFLKSIKPGLISKYLSISELTLQLLTMFIKNVPQCYQIIKTQLMPTLMLCLRRHGCQLGPIIKSLTQLVGYNKNLLTLFLANGNANEVALLMIQMINQSQTENQVNEVFQQFKMEDFVITCIEGLKNSQLFTNAATFLIKLIQHNYTTLLGNAQVLSKFIQTLGSLYLSKRGDIMIYSNLLFSFLHLYGKRKNAIAPQIFKLALDRYRSALNQDQSHNYLFNFLQIIQEFPSIPTVGIAEAILNKYQNQTSYIGQLQLDILLNSIQNIDEKLALRIYNVITKIFVEQVGSIENISNILETIIRKFDTKIIFDLTVKFIKICLAVYYANLRKLNYSKSLIDGTIKLDKSNVFYKAKNNEIQKLLTNIILIRDQKLNKTLQPLVCYSFFQSQIKNKDESYGIKRVMTMLGDQEQLRKIYENDAKLMLQDVRNQGKKNINEKVQNERYKQGQSKIRVTSDATLLIKKKNFLYNSSNPPKVSSDAQKGLEKYTRVFLEKVGKHVLEQERKNQDEERKQELRKKFTVKILEKGIKISKQTTVNCIYEFNARQKQLQKDIANDFSYLPYYDPENQEERDVKAVQYLLKKYAKLFKVYYNNYGGKLRPNTIKLFDDISERGNLMQSANVWKLLRDHFLDEFITVNEVHYLVQKINAQLKKQYKDSSVLDYEVFQNFIVQAAQAMFSRPPKDLRSYGISSMIQQIVSRLKEHAKQNRIDQRLFEENEVFQSNKSEQLKDLNQKLQENPDYILPEGYKKQTIKKITFDYKFYLHALNESYKDVYEVLDQILSQKIGFHIIQAYSVTAVQATARPILYQTQFDYSMKERSLSSILPRQAKSPRQPKQGEEETQNGESNVQASKIQNKFLKEKRLKEEERRQKIEQQQKRREDRDKQLKALLQKHREKQQQLQNEKEEKKNQEARKLQQEKKKREKYEQDLKRKVSQFAQKKKLQKSKEQQQLKRKKEEEIRNMQKLKQDVERKKKMVEESKIKKKYDEDLKVQLQTQEAKIKQQENKLKLAEKKEKTKKLLEQYKQKKQHKQKGQNQSLGEITLKQHLNSSKQPPKQKINKTKQMTVQQLQNNDN